MMLDEIQRLLEDYRIWLKDRTSLRDINGSSVEITTPYLDRHNDALQIYARRENAGFVLTDDRYTIHDLEASGCSLSTQKRKDLLAMTLNGFGVKLNDQAIEVHATTENFPARKHNLVQAMLAVNDLFYLAKPVVESLFYEDVIEWLDANDVRYTPKAKFTGTGGYDHLFDFVIPKSRRHPERILQAINRPTRDNAESSYTRGAIPGRFVHLNQERMRFSMTLSRLCRAVFWTPSATMKYRRFHGARGRS